MSTEQKQWLRQTCDKCRKVQFEGPVDDNTTYDTVLFRNPRLTEYDRSFRRDPVVQDLCKSCLADCLREWLLELDK